METHATCPRKHYLDHVVRAIDDPTASDGSDAADAGSRIVGTVFHDVAEEAFHREYETREAWREAAVRQLTARDLLEHREGVLACIDRYFEARAPGYDRPVAEWEPLAAELPFALEDVSGVGGDVIGYVDSVRRPPDGSGLVVLDYKATAERIDPGEATQLALYVRACEDRFDEPIAAAGYVHVGDVDGPRVDLFDPDDLPPWDAVRADLEAVDDPAYDETSPGEHCRYCSHRSLGCAPEEYADARSGLEAADDD